MDLSKTRESSQVLYKPTEPYNFLDHFLIKRIINREDYPPNHKPSKIEMKVLDEWDRIGNWEEEHPSYSAGYGLL